MMQIDNKFESTNRANHMIWWRYRYSNMSHVPTMLKSDKIFSGLDSAQYFESFLVITCADV